jgi:hypothetical protein
MRQFGTVARLVAVCAVLLALSGTRSGAVAQETGASYYVSVGCWPVGDGSLSACSFTASASDGAAIEAMWVPAWIACAEVVDAGGAEWTGDGYHVYSGSLTLTLVGSVSAGGGGSYMVRVNGTAVEAAGDGLFCSPAPVVEQPEGTTDDGAVEAPVPEEGESPDGGNTTSPDDTADDGTTDDGTADDGTTDDGTSNETPPDDGTTDDGTSDDGTTDDGTTDDSTTDDGATDDGASDDGATDSGTPDAEADGNATAGEGTTGEAPAAETDEEEASPEASGDGTLAEAPSVAVTEDQSPEVAEEEEAEEEDADAAEAEAAEVDVTITVFVYNCAEDPGDTPPSDPASGCVVDPGNALTATEDGNPLTATPCDDGSCFTATTGTSFVVSETVPAGHDPIGDGAETINPVTEAATIVFVNVAYVEEVPQLGRIQIILGSCLSRDAEETKFTIIPPRSFRTAAEQSCDPTPGAVLTISGGTLAGGVQAITDGDGVWIGYLPPGDDYQVSGDAGTSPPVPIVADEVTAVVIIAYHEGPSALLTITKVDCSVGEANGTRITVSSEGPDTGDEGCVPANGQFMLAEQAEVRAQDSMTFSLGSDGIETKKLPVGSYVLTDLGSGESAGIDLVEGGSTYASVRSVTLYGRLVVRQYFCADPGSNDQDPGDASYWKDQCTQPLGGTLTLSNANGDPIETRNAKVMTWNELDPGTYFVSGDDGVCAALVGNGDARSGFNVDANVTTRVNVYTCAASNGNGGDDDGDDDDGDDDGGGNNNGGGDDDSDDDGGGGGGGGGTDNAASDDEEVANVTTLPSTGAGTGNPDLDELALLALTLPILLAGAALSRRRAT